ncbi:response regulator transcription factor [Christensenella timonensis]|uniref:response regulator transcription factor n=1 Tax=Christensenella timonensis TaxID=1816678 RepID=UPI0008322782|nr:response regulator transcription factor [Christensenella timonensis]
MVDILVVEDEIPISNLISMNLRENGYCCDVANDGMKAADLIEENTYDLILLDIMLPHVSGYELMEYIRPLNVPVIFITAKNDVADRVKGLHLGADDYIVKPFEIVELLARVEAVLRRYNKGESRIGIGDVEINTQSRSVKKNGRQVDLTMKEYELLLLFIRNKNIALFRETIFERVWQSEYLGDTRTVDLHVQRLRKKLGWEKLIVAVYKVGYRLEV